MAVALTPVALHQLQQLAAFHTVSGVVRAGVDAAGLAVHGDAQVAHGRLLLLHRHHAPGAVVTLLHELVHVDIAVGAILGAVATADAPILDDDLARVPAVDGIDRAADHAVRIEARPARAGDQELVETQA